MIDLLPPRVYLVKNKQCDFTGLSSFSPLPPIILVEGSTSFSYATQRAIGNALRNFRSDIDYIVPGGNAALAMLTAMILADTFNCFSYRILLYSASSSRYTVKHVDGYIKALAKEDYV